MDKQAKSLGILLLVILDVLCINVVNIGMFYTRFFVIPFPYPTPPLQPYIYLWILTNISIILGFYWQKSYVFPRRACFSEHFRSVSKVVFLSLITMIVLIFISKGLSPRALFRFSRLVFFLTWIMLFIGLLMVRYFTSKVEIILFKFKKYVKNIAIVGAGDEADSLKRRIEEKSWLGYDIKGFINNANEKSEWGRIHLGKISDIPKIIEKEQIDEIMLTYQEHPDRSMLEAVLVALDCDVTICMSPVLFHFLVGQFQMGNMPDLESVNGKEKSEQMMRKVVLDMDKFYTKIAMIGLRGIPATYGGVEKAVDQLSTRLVGHGFQVYVYCRRYYTSLSGRYKGVQLIRLPTINTKHLDTSIHTILSTIHAIFQGFHVIHYHAMGPSILSLVPRLAGIHTIVTVQGLDWKRDKWGELARSILKFGEYTSIRFPSKTIVVSKTLRDYFRKHYNLAISYIPNGIPIPTLRPPGKIQELRLEKNNYILFVGRLVPEKGCHYLIKAFTQLQTNKKLVIVGGSSHSDAYVTKLKKIGDERVIFTGYIYDERLEEFFTNAYLYVLPSNIEGLPISLLEAMSFGVCVLSSDIPENVEVLEQKNSPCIGFTFKKGDVENLKQKLSYLLQHPEEVEKTGKKARIFVQKHFSWDKIAKDTDQVYHFALRKKN